MKKWIALILTACLLIGSLSGCGLLGLLLEELPQDGLEYVTQGGDKVTAEGNPLLEFTLNEQMEQDFYNLLEELEQVAIAGQSQEQVDALTEALDDAYMLLVDQYQIAYIQYCLDQSDEAMKQRYLDCADMAAEMDAAYNQMCKRVYLSETPLRDYLFEDWTQEEIDMLLAYDDEIAQLEKRNTELTVQFRELDMYSDSWDSDMVELYNEMVQNNNTIAGIYGFENYYVYATKMVYQRDYGQEQLTQLRQYAAQYLPTLCRESADRFSQIYDGLEDSDAQWISQYVYNDYRQLEKNYVDDFMAAMPQSSREMMGDMFSRDRAIFTDYGDSYQGAFTTWIGGEPFCFFGNGYTNSETVIHELGHYYGSAYVEPWSQPMDLSETQSQGNEWMFIRYMEGQLPAQLATVLTEYKLTTDLGYILCFVLIDAFEQQIYSHPDAGDMTLEEYDAVMEQVAKNYGGLDFINEYIMDIQTYWKMVVLESPVYYISYGVSGIAAISLYTLAVQDEAAATEAYRKLMEEPVEDGGFLENIQNAGIAGPFDETVYQQLLQRYEA